MGQGRADGIRVEGRSNSTDNASITTSRLVPKIEEKLDQVASKNLPRRAQRSAAAFTFPLNLPVALQLVSKRFLSSSRELSTLDHKSQRLDRLYTHPHSSTADSLSPQPRRHFVSLLFNHSFIFRENSLRTPKRPLFVY